MITYKKIASNGGRRLYKLSESISKNNKGKLIRYEGENISINYILLSDAHTHLERLAFPVVLKNCETEEQAVSFFMKHGAKSTLHEFKNKEMYGTPYVETNYVNIGGNPALLINGFEGSNSELLMSDEEILDEIIEANMKVISE